jgi:hypothetical protein
LKLPEGFQKLCSRCGSVFVDESAENVVALDRVQGWFVALVAACGCEESECSVRPLGVVVGDVAAEHVFEVAAAEDQ